MQDFLAAALNTKVERYDIQVNLRDFDTFVAEEVHVYGAKVPQLFRLLALTEHPAEPQSNWDATDSSGTKLVLIPWPFLDAHYRHILERAFRVLDGVPATPAPLQGLLNSPFRAERLLDNWHEGLTQLEMDATGDFLSGLAASLPAKVNDDQACLFMLSEFMTGRFYGYFLPWIMVEWHADRDPFFFVKYSVQNRRPEARTLDRAWSAISGWFDAGMDLSLLQSGSSHVRMRPPPGLVIERLGVLTADRVKTIAEREQLEFYLKGSDAEDLSLNNEAVPQLTFVARVSQSSSIRGLVGVLFLGLALLPLAIALGEFPRLWDGVTSADLVDSFSLGGMGNLVRAVKTQDVVDGTAIALPLAFGLVAAAWDRPSVRAYAVTQLVLALGVVSFWLIGSHAGEGVEGTALGVFAIFAGVLLGFYNILHALLVFGKLPVQVLADE